MEKVVIYLDLGVFEVAIITRRVLQMTNKFKHSNMQISEQIANRQVPK